MIDLFGTFITAGLFLTTQLKSEFPPLNCNMKGVTKSVISNNIEYQVVNSSFCRKHRVWASAVVALWKDSKRITTSEVGLTLPYSVCTMGNKRWFLWIPPCHKADTDIMHPRPRVTTSRLPVPETPLHIPCQPHPACKAAPSHADTMLQGPRPLAGKSSRVRNSVCPLTRRG